MAGDRKELTPLTFPKIPPERVVGNYVQSKIEDSVQKRYPEWDVARPEPAAELVEARRELHQSERRLVDKKADAKKAREHMDRKWHNLEHKEEMLKDSFIKFNKFVKENQEKRERAERKNVEEMELRGRRQADLDALQKGTEQMLETKRKMERNVKSHKLYEEFLSEVVKEYPTAFRTIDDVLNRYEALEEARTVAGERQEVTLVSLENAKAEMLQLIEDKTQSMMGLNNKVAELQARYETARNKTLRWEAIVAKIATASAETVCELQRVNEGIRNVYQYMCKRKEIRPELEPEDIEAQLLFIKRTMLELKGITAIAKRRAAKQHV